MSTSQNFDEHKSLDASFIHTTLSPILSPTTTSTLVMKPIHEQDEQNEQNEQNNEKKYLNNLNDKSNQALYDAVWRGNCDQVKQLLSYTNPNYFNVKEGKSCIDVAVESHCADIVKVLLDDKRTIISPDLLDFALCHSLWDIYELFIGRNHNHKIVRGNYDFEKVCEIWARCGRLLDYTIFLCNNVNNTNSFKIFIKHFQDFKIPAKYIKFATAGELIEVFPMIDVNDEEVRLTYLLCIPAFFKEKFIDNNFQFRSTCRLLYYANNDMMFDELISHLGESADTVIPECDHQSLLGHFVEIDDFNKCEKLLEQGASVTKMYKNFQGDLTSLLCMAKNVKMATLIINANPIYFNEESVKNWSKYYHTNPVTYIVTNFAHTPNLEKLVEFYSQMGFVTDKDLIKYRYPLSSLMWPNYFNDSSVKKYLAKAGLAVGAILGIFGIYKLVKH